MFKLFIVFIMFKLISKFCAAPVGYVEVRQLTIIIPSYYCGFHLMMPNFIFIFSAESVSVSTNSTQPQGVPLLTNWSMGYEKHVLFFRS